MQCKDKQTKEITKENIKLYYNGNITFSITHSKNIEAMQSTKRDYKKQKKYKLTYAHSRKIASSAAYQYHNRKNKITFLTFTLKDNVTDTNLTNKAWTEYLNYLRKQYKMHSFIWVAERQKRGAVHYHALIDIPKTPYSILKEQFSRIFKKYDINVSAKNSISTSKQHGAIVNDIEKAVKYITKYVTKGAFAKDEEENKNTFNGRVYGISNNINIKPITLTRKEFNELLITVKAIYKFEYSTTYICDTKESIKMYEKIQSQAIPISKTWFNERFKEMPQFYECESMENMYKNINL